MSPSIPLVALVVDDCPFNADLVSDILRDHGFITIVRHNGEDGARAFKKELPDVVVTDLHMPRGNGIDLIRSIRCGRVESHTPIVVLTNLPPDDAFDLGVTAASEAASAVLHMARHFDRLVPTVMEVLDPGNRTALRARARQSKRQQILEELERCEGNVAATARSLGVSRQTVYSYMSEQD